MTLAEFYAAVIKFGTLVDPRKKKEVLFNDTAILHGTPKTIIKRILVGIDIEMPEISLRTGYVRLTQ